MLRSKYFLLATLLFLYGFIPASDIKYHYTLDLTRVVDDKVYVELSIEGLTGDELVFNMPKMIPGTYTIEDYGRFISDFKALNKKGKELPVSKSSTNSWTISKANKLVKISYWVEDSYDTTLDGPEIFQPAGTNIEEGKNFIINSSGYFGYFEGHTSAEYEISIIRPDGFYGSTGLIPTSTNNEFNSVVALETNQMGTAKVDIFNTGSYDELVDSPIMYSLPDTTVINVAGSEVLVASYSPNKIVSAKEIGNTIKEVLMAQKDYLGGSLPVDKYAFIFYFTDQPIMEYGALEHSYSSFYYMPEYALAEINQQLRDFAAHEFFHIVTPLTIHSKEIQPFNFTNPEMSKHLWLYEGMTEYFAGNAQIQGGLISIDQYINSIREKIFISEEYNDSLPFTELSLGALNQYEDQFYNVYQKGAMIGLALDLTLLELSEGEYGVQNMMKDLSSAYGKDKAFEDDELFDVITSMTYPEVRDFFATYVEGTSPLDYVAIFKKAGVIYDKNGLFYDYSFGLTDDNLGVDIEGGTLFIQNEEKLDEFGKALAYKDGDILIGFNGTEIPPLGPAVMQYLQETLGAMEEDKDFTVTVLRKNQTTEEEETIILSAPVTKVGYTVPHAIRPDENATEAELVVRRAWLGLD